MALTLPPELEPHRRLIEAAVRPAIRLEPPAGPGGAAAQYGGEPLVPPGTAWPEGKRGPLHFIGHLDFARIRAEAGAAAEPLPADGVLALFGDPLRMLGSALAGDGWRLLHTPRSADAVRLEVPARLRRFPFSLWPFKPRPLSGRPFPMAASAMDSLPQWDESDGFPETPPEDDSFWEAYHEHLFPSDHTPVHKVLGHAHWIQCESRAAAEAIGRGLGKDAAYKGPDAEDILHAARRWRLLWQIDSDRRAGMMWGDLGRNYLLITDEDLAAARFDRVVMLGDCY